MIAKSIYKGIIASVLLLAFYFTIASSISGWNFAKSQFGNNRYWIISLAVGFGIQIFLFTYLRKLHKEKMSGKIAAVSGTTSGLAMVACCAHYLVNIIPIIGIGAFATLIGQYQTWIFAVGLIFNLTGITYMLRQLYKLKI